MGLDYWKTDVSPECERLIITVFAGGGNRRKVGFRAGKLPKTRIREDDALPLQQLVLFRNPVAETLDEFNDSLILDRKTFQHEVDPLFLHRLVKNDESKDEKFNQVPDVNPNLTTVESGAEICRPVKDLRVSTFWLELCLPLEVGPDLASHLEVLYERWVTKFGERKARLMWNCHIASFITRHWFDRLLTVFERVRKVFWSF